MADEEVSPLVSPDRDGSRVPLASSRDFGGGGERREPKQQPGDTILGSIRVESFGLEEGPVRDTGGASTDEAPVNLPQLGQDREKLGVLPLTVIIFYSVSGGPFGCEASVRAGGYFYTLLGFLVMPFIWSLQEALITAELGTAFQEASGGVAWVEEAFGQSAGWMCGYLGWIAGATDNSIYPLLFLDYLLQALHSDGESVDPWLRFFLVSGTSLVLGYINWLGLSVVGKISEWICLLAVSPFIVLVLVGAFQVEPSRWFERPEGDTSSFEDTTDDDTSGGFFPDAAFDGIILKTFFNNLFWNLNSFDSAASFAADIQEPGRVLPKAMTWSVAMVSCCYFFPLLVAIGATKSKQEDWQDGYLATVASEIAGPWLGAWTVFAAGISNIGQFQAELSADAFQLMGMADRGHVPKIFSTRSRHGTPTYGIVLGIAVVLVMGVSDLDTLIELLNFNYAISLLLEYCAFIKLRISQPDLDRPYRIPLSTTGCVIMLVPTVAFTLLVLALATYQTYVFSVAVIVFGFVMFKVGRRFESLLVVANQDAGYASLQHGQGDSPIEFPNEYVDSHDTVQQLVRSTSPDANNCKVPSPLEENGA